MLTLQKLAEASWAQLRADVMLQPPVTKLKPLTAAFKKECVFFCFLSPISMCVCVKSASHGYSWVDKGSVVCVCVEDFLHLWRTAV